jgi:uncharacterized protein with von Willebrand factor type A (vWA) domain
MARTPFVNGNRVEREFDLQMQSVRLGVKTAEEAMRDLTRLVNEGIVDQLELDPTLRGPYLERIRAGARPAWDPGDPMPAFLQE